MTIDVIRDVLLLCSILNVGFFFLAFLIYRFGRDFVYRIHGRWYKVPEDSFNTVIIGSMVFYKICILFFNIAPYFVLRIVG
jgi:hypothetical protein